MQGANEKLDDKQVSGAYSTLKELAREVVSDMLKHEKNVDLVGMSWSQIGKVDSSIHDRYALLLEKRASSKLKLDLFLCQGMWAAKLLLSEALKNRRTVSSRSSLAESSQDNDEGNEEESDAESSFR